MLPLFYYTIVGSRDISQWESDTLFDAAYHLSSIGGILRSGNATGSDLAAEDGHYAAMADGLSKHYPDIFTVKSKGHWRPYTTLADVKLNDYQAYEDALRLVSEIHPAPDRLNKWMLDLHTRNMFQPLGVGLDNPSKLLIACADKLKNGDAGGGTRTAWTLAKQNGIPCFNIRNRTPYELECFINSIVF